jgi:hypothetical protein
LSRSRSRSRRSSRSLSDSRRWVRMIGSFRRGPPRCGPSSARTARRQACHPQGRRPAPGGRAQPTNRRRPAPALSQTDGVHNGAAPGLPGLRALQRRRRRARDARARRRAETRHHDHRLRARATTRCRITPIAATPAWRPLRTASVDGATASTRSQTWTSTSPTPARRPREASVSELAFAPDEPRGSARAGPPSCMARHSGASDTNRATGQLAGAHRCQRNAGISSLE